MDSLLEIFTIAFLIGLTGALAPGPTLVATITTSLGRGWTAGPLVAFGHIAVEAAVAAMIVLGLAQTGFADRIGVPVALVGGGALVAFGAMTLRDARTATITREPGGRGAHPVAAGALTTVVNPYFWIWWLSVGALLLFTVLPGGLVAVGVFMAGHFLADLGWFTLVSTGMHRGADVLSVRQYRWILGICGLFLVVLGISYPLGMLLGPGAAC